jgi:hypothetical protein
MSNKIETKRHQSYTFMARLPKCWRSNPNERFDLFFNVSRVRLECCVDLLEPPPLPEK